MMNGVIKKRVLVEISVKQSQGVILLVRNTLGLTLYHIFPTFNSPKEGNF